MAKRREGTSDGDDSKKEGGGEEQGRGKARRRGRMKARILFLTIRFIFPQLALREIERDRDVETSRGI
eukprot:1363875-Amorphochlora_amoeboformis.AAC.1